MEKVPGLLVAGVDTVENIDQFFQAAEAVEFHSVVLPNGTIQRIGSISSADVIEWEEVRVTPEGRKISGALLIMKSIVNKDGKRIGIIKPYLQFTDAEKAQLQRIQNGNNDLAETLLRAILRFNGMSGFIPPEQRVKENAAKESAVKND